jgi:hypothetical protein
MQIHKFVELAVSLTVITHENRWIELCKGRQTLLLGSILIWNQFFACGVFEFLILQQIFDKNVSKTRFLN